MPLTTSTSSGPTETESDLSSLCPRQDLTRVPLAALQSIPCFLSPVYWASLTPGPSHTLCEGVSLRALGLGQNCGFLAHLG